MFDSKKEKKDPLEFVLYSSIALLVIGLMVSIYYYKETFSGGISNVSADWSALGSFIGGVFAPAVSFVTLVAIIITIRLQKKFLENQFVEFSRLYDLQVHTFEKQVSQLDSAKDAHEYEKINSYKQTILSVIDQQIDVHQKIIDRCTSSSEYLIEKKLSHTQIDLGNKLEEVLERKEEYEQRLNYLVNLSISIAVSKYKTVSEVDRAFAEGYASL